ncbi:MAG: pyridoxine 5'-phosphate synthase [Acidobacteria bacterium RIFCSPLOWO2_02_FULL_65_29]|nr:MAG: pyridoxine 5'-phosphate synthase [Acidobacteria bacterium RIFCSPLOWO2_02_FULL_65_29]
MIRLSVNVNKVATLRNSRGGSQPSVLDAVAACLDAGVAGITVHPRADRRHVTPEDVRDIAEALEGHRPGVELNIEGDPRPDLIDLVLGVVPDQCTLVPVAPGEITSQAGWRQGPESTRLPAVVRQLASAGIRVSVFVDPDPSAIRFAAAVHADRVELYTEPFARAFERGPSEAERSLATYADAARLAHSLGMGVNAGHDLDVDNLVVFRELPHLDEVSIGHAIISRAVFVGLPTVLAEYRAVLGSTGSRGVV